MPLNISLSMVVYHAYTNTQLHVSVEVPSFSDSKNMIGAK